MHRWFADLCVFDQADHFGKRGVVADGPGLDVDEAVDVDGAGRDRIARHFGDEIAFASDEGFVNFGFSACDDAIDSHLIARAADDDVAHF